MNTRASPRFARRFAAALLLAAGLGASAQPRSNVFNDPFLQVTQALPACPVPEPPGVTEQEARQLAHERSQRGVSCWLDGRCRLPNSYLYDAEIIPRVQQALRVDGHFADTSIWATGQRRWVWLQGCVTTPQQAAAAEQLVRRIDDVEGVVNQLMVGTGGTPAYSASAPKR
ncbi:MAG TPA: BON domain-containing protein [Albitalea sp.]|nr:BON domain-containing protein [Albitalea sp.]